MRFLPVICVTSLNALDWLGARPGRGLSKLCKKKCLHLAQFQSPSTTSIPRIVTSLMTGASSSEVGSPRTLWSLLGGVALASSAISIVGVLGVQRLARRRKRHELEDDVWSTTQGERKPKSSEKIKTDDRKSDAGPTTPKYLAHLSAVQATSTSPNTPARKGSPRPVTTSRPSLVNQNTKGGSWSLEKTRTGYDENLIREQLSRNYSFLGDEAMQRLRNSFVIVVGAGGVGSWCAIMLLRSGIGRLRLIDFDQVSLSSLNRHACANLADVGRPKVVVCKEKFAEIAPWADVDARVDIFRGKEASRLLEPAKPDPSRNFEEVKPTYVVDCIDNLDTKIDLLAFCHEHQIKCFSSMGAGAKADPSQIQVADLNTTAEDPLARRVRRGLRAKGIWGGGVLDKKLRKTSEKSETAENQEMTSKKEEFKASQQQAALRKLEGDVGSGTTKRLMPSGRGAEENITDGVQERNDVVNNASRRTSSTSSIGSGIYYSPASTPEEISSETPGIQPNLVHYPEDDNSDKTIRRASSQQDSSQVRLNDSEPDAPVPVSLHRPPLSLNPESHGDSASRRTSSLKELVAEDTRSSQSGKTANQSELQADFKDGDNVRKEPSGSDVAKPYTIMCVYTNEKSDTRLLPLDEEEFKKGNVDELAALEDFRVRILPVLGPLPAMFGLAAATYIICDISGRKLETLPFKGRRKTAERVSR